MNEPRTNHYTDRQIDILLNLYLRDHQRPAPWPAIAAAMGIEIADSDNVLYRMLWGVVTGYDGKHPTGPRRKYVATNIREGRVGWAWRLRETELLALALEGVGQHRSPACDMTYIAAVLARSVAEVQMRWAWLRPGRTDGGFGLGKNDH
jgi:hypothetical protein